VAICRTSRHPVGVQLHRPVAGRQILQPVELRLGRRQSAVERGRGIGGDPLVEQAALGEQVVAPLAGDLQPAAGRVEPDRRRAVE